MWFIVGEIQTHMYKYIYLSLYIYISLYIYNMLYGPFFPHLRIHGLSRLQPGSAIEQVNILNSF